MNFDCPVAETGESIEPNVNDVELNAIAHSFSKIFEPELKVAQNSFQHLYWMGRYNHSLALDAIIMVSKNFSSIGEHVAIIFLTQ